MSVTLRADATVVERLRRGLSAGEWSTLGIAEQGGAYRFVGSVDLLRRVCAILQYPVPDDIAQAAVGPEDVPSVEGFDPPPAVLESEISAPPMRPIQIAPVRPLVPRSGNTGRGPEV